jgi:hypothetical protein
VGTLVDAAAAEKYGVKTDGNGAAGTADVLAELAALIDNGLLEVPIAKVYPLTEVRDAYRELTRNPAQANTNGHASPTAVCSAQRWRRCGPVTCGPPSRCEQRAVELFGPS